MRYRWLDSERPVEHKKLGRGRIVTLPIPGRIGNVLVDFSGALVVVPAGALRNSGNAVFAGTTGAHAD